MAHYCAAHGITVVEAVVAMGIMNEEEARRMFDPIPMTNPDRMAEAIARFLGIKV